MTASSTTAALPVMPLPGKDVEAILNYTVDDGITPWVYDRPTTRQDPHKARFGGTEEPVRVLVHNARQNPELSLDRNAFQYVKQNTALSTQDFYDNPHQTIDRVYYPEMEALIAQHLGATNVVIINHQVRNESKRGAGTYAKGVHCDFAPSWAEDMYRRALTKLPTETDRTRCAKGRFVVVNAWRNISVDPIEQDHLAVCDETSLVQPDDYIPGEFRGYGIGGKQFRLASRNAHQHRWYYLPNMQHDEVLIFKQHDSDPNLSGRHCFHTAFRDATARDDAPPRESIEVRAVAFFPDHEPNTCPSSKPEPVTMAVDRVKMGLETVSFWPLVLRWYYRWALSKPDGVVRLVDFLLTDASGHFQLKGLTEATRTAARSLILKDSDFARHAQSTKLRLEAMVAAGRKCSPWTWWFYPSNW